MAKRGRAAGFIMGPEHRGKIKNSNVLSGLIAFAQGDIPPDEYPPHRVTASLGLLKKIMPDITESNINANVQGDMVGKIVVEYVSPKTTDT